MAEVLEAKIEGKLTRDLKAYGFIVVKLTTPGTLGSPDRLIIRPLWSPGPPWVIEVKRPKKHERRIQEIVRDDWRARGVRFLDMVNTFERVDELVFRLVWECLGDALK